MGFVIVVIVGAIFGWLAAIVVERNDRVGTAMCTLAGLTGAVTGAILAGDVPLIAGISPTQLLWAVVGAIVAIVAINAAGVRRLRSGQGNV
ncbi:MAG TPA: hypothetical protein VFS87_10020 [Qipengyuania sp.]|nr:hypothetical protein [Qipengyuania sp.]